MFIVSKALETGCEGQSARPTLLLLEGEERRVIHLGNIIISFYYINTILTEFVFHSL